MVAVVGASATAQDPVRTADVRERGLTPADFPRISTLANGVYAYEQIDPTKRIVTVNNLIVVSTDGVLVADGQGTEDNATSALGRVYMELDGELP